MEESKKKTENCMICGEELVYLTTAIPVTCTYCGLYGADAAAIATGIAISTILKASPLTDYERRTANMMTSRALAAIASNRGARCCKRSTFVALDSAIQYFREVLGTELEYIPVSKLKCEHSFRNKTCSRADCRFYAGKVL